jgi:type I restriction enzyme S subunit
MIPHFKKGDFPKLRFSIPIELDEQRRIAGILGALDDLIEVNRGLIDSQLALVNVEYARRFGNSQLSLPLGSIARVIDCLHSKKPDRVPAANRLLQLSNITNSGLLDLKDLYGISDEDYLRWTKNLETREWDCVITNVGRVGAVARVPQGVRSALGRNMTAIRPESPEADGAFVLASLLSAPVRREISLKTDSGTVMDALNVKNIPSLRLPEVSPESRLEFQNFARPLLQLADALTIEINELEATRDELLPLLMSGRIRVGEESAA